MRARSTYQDVMRALFVVLLLLLASCARTKGEIGKVAPGFGAATAWLNVDHPLSLEELRGKVVVVDFWTSCCINCIHTLPVLAAIEHRFEGKPVVVVGVHSAKFDVEGEQERLRSIISEYSIRHPIAVDGSMKIWDSWGARAWPSLYVLDPSGRVVWMGSGEPTAETIGTAVESALAMGPLDPKPLVGLVREKDDSGSLSFPGRAVVLADGTLAIADTGHHRIVLANADGSVIAVAGSGLAGLADGGFSEASFRKPQGIAEKGGIVYVADTENHVLRALDRATRKVTTVAGTGKLGVGPLTASAPATSVALRSPWDVLALGDIVYVALAGSHQIAAFSPSKGTIEPFAGDGEERRLDGAGQGASFAQPSALATDGASLYVADSETSSVREISLATRDVHTLVGQDLFVFGDVDGPAPQVRLEHPLGVAFGGGAVWVADTYNSKLKRIDHATLVTSTLAGGRNHAALFEPESVFFAGEDLLVADTKHHRIVRVALKDGSVHPITLTGLAAPETGVVLAGSAAPASVGDAINLGEVALAKAGSTTLHFDWKLPEGTGVNAEGPFHVRWTSSDGLATVPTELKGVGAKVEHGFDLAVTPVPGAGGGRLIGELGVVTCDTATHLVCVPVRRAIEIRFRVATDTPAPAAIMIPLPAAKP
jgi:thiol-disulfide isomerase/thioredoxin